MLALANKGNDNDDADSAVYMAREETESTSSHQETAVTAKTSEELQSISSHQVTAKTKHSDSGVGESKASTLDVSIQ